MTTIEPGIFKAYDVRGLYPEQLDEDLARRIGRAFVAYLGARRIAMSRDMRSRPATMSRTQFEYARKHGKRYSLYVVEHAGTDGPRIVPIQNPAGRDSTYTFDHGWRAAAEGTEGDD